MIYSDTKYSFMFFLLLLHIHSVDSSAAVYGHLPDLNGIFRDGVLIVNVSRRKD